MSKERKGRARATNGTTEQEQLDALNARRRSKGNAPEVIRRTIEAQVESKARKRRTQEAPASSAWKR